MGTRDVEQQRHGPRQQVGHASVTQGPLTALADIEIAVEEGGAANQCIRRAALAIVECMGDESGESAADGRGFAQFEHHVVEGVGQRLELVG